MDAEGGFAPPAPAYEAGKLLLLYSAIINLFLKISNSEKCFCLYLFLFFAKQKTEEK